MIGLDTNILVRYITQDKPAQAAQATTLMQTRLTEDDRGFISIVAIAEMVWVLGRHYRFASGQIAGAIERMLRTDTLIVESEQQVFEAMTALREGHGEFGDALIGLLSAKAGCSRVLTFDRKALRLPGFELP